MNGQKLEWQDEVLAQLQAGLISLEEAEQRLLNGPGSGSSASNRELQRTTPKGASLPPQRIETGDIAIIGMACRFPDANDWRTLWANLKAGVDSIGEAPAGRWPAPGRPFPSAGNRPSFPAPSRLTVASGATPAVYRSLTG